MYLSVAEISYLSTHFEHRALLWVQSTSVIRILFRRLRIPATLFHAVDAVCESQPAIAMAPCRKNRPTKRVGKHLSLSPLPPPPPQTAGIEDPGNSILAETSIYFARVVSRCDLLETVMIQDIRCLKMWKWRTEFS